MKTRHPVNEVTGGEQSVLRNDAEFSMVPERAIAPDTNHHPMDVISRRNIQRIPQTIGRLKPEVRVIRVPIR